MIWVTCLWQHGAMTTRFDGRRRSRHDDQSLSGLPAWGLEMMMGLYGPETIRRACAEETELARPAQDGRERQFVHGEGTAVNRRPEPGG